MTSKHTSRRLGDGCVQVTPACGSFAAGKNYSRTMTASVRTCVASLHAPPDDVSIGRRARSPLTNVAHPERQSQRIHAALASADHIRVSATTPILSLNPENAAGMLG